MKNKKKFEQFKKDFMLILFSKHRIKMEDCTTEDKLIEYFQNGETAEELVDYMGDKYDLEASDKQIDLSSFVWRTEDRITTCPKCGSRTNIELEIPNKLFTQVHRCLDNKCGYLFVEEE